MSERKHDDSAEDNRAARLIAQAEAVLSARVIEEAEVIRLNNEAFNAFMAACEADSEPNEALLAAQRRRKQRIDSGYF